MEEKLDVYKRINSKNYLRFELNESNEKEYLNKLISVRDALVEVERKNNEVYDSKVSKLETFKNEIREFYYYIQEVNDSELELQSDFDSYYEKYINPINELTVRKGKLQVQVVPYITNGFWQKIKAYFSYEGRAKLTIEKQFNKELKSVDKEIKDLNLIKQKNSLTFSEREGEIYKAILQNVDLDLINGNQVLDQDQVNEFKTSLTLSRNKVIKDFRVKLLNKIADYVEVCSDYLSISDLNIEEHYKFKNTEYKLYLQEGYLDNDCYSVSKYLEASKGENDFVGKQAANRLVDGIQECIYELENIISNNGNDVKLA